MIQPVGPRFSNSNFATKHHDSSAALVRQIYPMLSFGSLFLYVIHCLYSFLSFFYFLSDLFVRRTPRELTADRNRIPRHLALIFVSPEHCSSTVASQALVDSAERAVNWCRMVGIKRLTLYDNQGMNSVCKVPGQVHLCTDRHTCEVLARHSRTRSSMPRLKFRVI